MANQFTFVKAPSRRLTGWADVAVDIGNASLDSDLDPTVSQFQVLNNFVTGGPGAISKRGGILNAGGNASNASVVTKPITPIAFYDGPIGANPLRPYIAFDWTDYPAFPQLITLNMLNSSAGLSVVPISSGLPAYPVSKIPTIDGLLVFAGTYASDSSGYTPGYVQFMSGSASVTQYGTGSVTMVLGSPSVVGSGTAWTAAMVGSIFIINNDSIPYQLNYYRVASVNSGTSITLDRPYNGDTAIGAGTAYSIINSVQAFGNASSGFTSTAGGLGLLAKVVASYGRRMFLASIGEFVGTNAPTMHKNRIRWSGTIGSTNADETGYANAASSGMFNFNANGYIDLGSQYGEILAMAPMQNSLVVFQTSGMTNLVGTPLWSSATGLDPTAVFPTVAINGGFAFETTPYGVFFFDKVAGPCLFDGTKVTRIGVNRVAQSMLPYDIVAVGYYNGKVLFSGSAQAGIFVYDIDLDSWSFHTPPAPVSPIIAGRVENSESIVGVCGKRIVNLQNLFDNPGVQVNDFDGTQIVANFQTGYIGETTNMIRPERMFVTYRCSDPGATAPYLLTTVRTGFQSIPTSGGFDVELFDVGLFDDGDDSQRTFASASTDFTATGSIVTKEVEVVNIQRDTMMSIALTTVGNTGRVDVMAVEVDAVFEGWNGSGT